LAKNYRKVTEYEFKVHHILEKEGITGRIPEKLSGRAMVFYNHIRNYLVPGTVLDLGCGDGKIGKIISTKKHKVVLADVYKNPNIKKTGLEFRLFRQGERVPARNNDFDNTIILTVLHHSDDSIKTIRESCRVTKPAGRVIAIESVYGVHGKGLNADDKRKFRDYLSLSSEQQRKSNMFFDHFYNRVIHYSKDPMTKVNVPFNFNTPENWKRLFEKNGLKQEKLIHLGIDLPIVPEYHTLHILRVKKKIGV
jgi:ubiquinone/menaquinone biosynthesis C-methylase UbiE